MSSLKHKWLAIYLTIILVSIVAPVMEWEELVFAQSEPTYDIKVELDVKVPMRDGIRLSTNIYRPDAEGKFPVILIRSPYGNGGAKDSMGHAYAKRGYVVVNQDTRGRFESEGFFDPFRTESQDGYDTQLWVGGQPWCNGKIGTAGGSYVGFTQWISAPFQCPYLKAMVPVVTFADFHDDIAYVGGAFQLALLMGWGSLMDVGSVENLLTLDWNKHIRHLPLSTWDEAVLKKRVPYLRDWVAHPDYDKYWENATVKGKYAFINAAAYNIGGWYDIFSKATTENFSQMVKFAQTPELKKGQKLLMGPWGHGAGVKDGKVGDVDFGKDAVGDLDAVQLRWFDYWLKGIQNGVLDEPPVRIFVMGENVWRDEQEFPLARTRYTKYYIHSGGKANTLDGDGRLDTTKPADELPDKYTFDPENPVPTIGGNNLIANLTPIGAFDQREVEKRPDVLVYTSGVLEEPIEVTGPVKMILYASSNAKDTDFTVKLVDVRPDGYAQNLTDGIIRARYRNSRITSELIEPNKVYPYEIDLWVTSNLFLSGHRMRLEISSSNFPRFDRNPNTGHDFGKDAEMMKAEQTVYHDRIYPSYLLLPVIPR